MLVQVQIKGGNVKKSNQKLMLSTKVKHSFKLLSKSILVHKEDLTVVKTILKRNYIPFTV